MNVSARYRLAIVGLCVCILGGTQQVFADHVDELALEVRTKADIVCWEMHRYYRYQPSYRDAYREAYEIRTVANHIHDLTHNRINADRVRRNVEELDALFHGLKDYVGPWDLGGQHGHPHSHHGLSHKMRSLEGALRHLMDDVGVRSGSDPAATPPPTP